ncbi:hypothetical protein B0H11DRAFT_1924758 [Mycena galericulata]|nr:hypothetical protein B0H11DRAFT_1924758 [Mycena galericulata]
MVSKTALRFSSLLFLLLSLCSRSIMHNARPLIDLTLQTQIGVLKKFVERETFCELRTDSALIVIPVKSTMEGLDFSLDGGSGAARRPGYPFILRRLSFWLTTGRKENREQCAVVVLEFCENWNRRDTVTGAWGKMEGRNKRRPAALFVRVCAVVLVSTMYTRDFYGLNKG